MAVVLRGWLLAAAVAISGPAAAQATGDLSTCLASLRAELPAHPTVRADSFDALTRDLPDLRPVIDTATQSQPEFKLAIWDYVARLADAQRAIDGREVLMREAAPLMAIVKRSGVDAATAVAVFGVETDYGRVRGKYPVIAATLSRACLNLDSQERKNHFFAALWLVQDGLVKAEDFRGSWAGAFGLTQFMPGTFIRYMDAADGAGQPDIIGNPGDALATTARFLVGLGWSSGLRWGVEVRAPKDIVVRWNALERDHGCVTSTSGATSTSSAGVDNKCKTVAQWTALGVVPLGGGVSAAGSMTAAGEVKSAPTVPSTVPSVESARSAWPAATRAALFAPAGPDGPVWLVSRNFHALWQYNRADAYALSIGLLSDALRGDPPLQAAWPTDDPAIGRIEFRELQSLLVARGHAEVVADGYDGPKTRDAIRQEEAAHGLAETGRGGDKLLRLLRRDAVPTAAAPSAASR